MEGTRHGKLVVVKLDRRGKRGGMYWRCRCDCGKETILLTSRLSYQKSCGCMRKRYNDPSIPAAARGLMTKYIHGAKARELAFELTIYQFVELTSQPCHYCGARPGAVAGKRNYRETYTYNGLDRMDNRLGYTLQNVVPCCKICNRAKNNSTYLEFLAWIDDLARFRRRTTG